jgi:hypothetical protein
VSGAYGPHGWLPSAPAAIDIDIKGPVGLYLETLAIFLKGDKRILDGLAKLEITDNAALLSYGASYELGRWRLGEGAVTFRPLIPFGGVQTMIEAASREPSARLNFC